MEPPSTSEFWAPQRRRDLAPDTLRQIRGVLDQTPDLPVSVHRVIQMASDPASDSREMAEAVSSDPVLVSNILMMVNSSYYGLSRKIDNLRLAIVLLGFNEVRSIALRCGFSQLMGSSGVTSYDTRSLWVHSCLVSACAEAMYAGEDPQRAGVLLTLGMLHDIGKFALYTLGMAMIEHGMRLHAPITALQTMHVLEKEERLFGMNHAIAGGLLAERWNLSDRMIAVLEHHHAPSFFGITEIPTEFQEDVAAVCVADLVVNRFEDPQRPLKYPHPLFFDILGYDSSLETIIPPALLEKLERAQSFINRLG